MKRKHAEIIYEECDGELERRIEDAMIELGRLRTLADAKTVEINVLISQRFSRLKVSPFLTNHVILIKHGLNFRVF